MTNEELVARIQAGEQELLPELWDKVERLVRKQANRLLLAFGDHAAARGLEFGDLYNSGYIALVDAAGSYDSRAGCAFTTWLVCRLKTAFAEAGGYRSYRQSQDPLHHTGSLESPLTGSKNSRDLGDLIPDPRAAMELQGVEDRIWLEQLRSALEQALGQLREGERDVIRARYYKGQTLAQVAQESGVYQETVRQRELKALRKLRRRRELESFVESRTPYYLRVGVQTFQSTHESAVEKIVFRREQMRGS